MMLHGVTSFLDITTELESLLTAIRKHVKMQAQQRWQLGKQQFAVLRQVGVLYQQLW
jgi:hypothetical protein